MKNVFLFGYYGFNNTGDEAILESIAQQFQVKLPNVKVTALSRDAADTMDKYGIDAVNRSEFKNMLQAIKASDIVISGGGSLLQDVTSSKSLMYYLAIIFIAKKLGKPVMFYGNGFGPIHKYYNKKIIKYIVNKVDIITVRDADAKKTMEELGINKEIVVTADTAFLLKGAKEARVKEIFDRINIDPSKKSIGISVREWKGYEKYKTVVAMVADYLAERGYEIIFVPMHYPDDIKTSEEIANRMKSSPKIIKEQYTPGEMISILGELHLLVGMRLHALIFSAVAGVPMVGLEYDEKIKSFLKLTNQKNGGRVEDLEFIELSKIIDGVMEDRSEYQKKVLEAREALHKKALMNIDILKDFMEKGEY